MTEVCGAPKQNVDVCVNTGWLKDFNDAGTMLVLTFKGSQIKEENNNNYPELNVPAIDAAMDEAEKQTDQAAADKAWATVDKMIMEEAPVVPYVWDNQANAVSANVKGVISRFNATWDYAFTSLK